MRKDGHTDVSSSRRMCKTIIEDANDILDALPRDMEASLPTWWTNKLAKSSAYMNSTRDYLVYSDFPMQEPREEMNDEEVVDMKTTQNIKWVAKLGSQAYGNVTIGNGCVFIGTNVEFRENKWKQIPLRQRPALPFRCKDDA